MEHQKILATLIRILGEQARARNRQLPAELDEKSELASMGFDSLDMSEIIAAVEEEFDCVTRMDDLIKLKSLSDFADLIMKQ